jgi:hypothetical protein
LIEEFCDTGKIKGFDLVNIQDIVKDIDVAMTNNTAKYMCTLNCTCPYDTDFNLWDET